MRDYVATVVLHAKHGIDDWGHESTLRDIIEKEFTDPLGSVSVKVSDVRIIRVCQEQREAEGKVAKEDICFNCIRWGGKNTRAKRPTFSSSSKTLRQYS